MVIPRLPAKGPLQKVALSHGYLGCLMYEPDSDQVQCHICGRWYRFLGAHLKRHGITDDAYRMEFGLTFNYPLCGKDLSDTRKADVTPNFIKCGVAMRKRMARVGLLTRGGERKPPRQIGTATESQKNKYGLCDLQIRKRYEALVESLAGRHPNSPQFRTRDRALLEAITRRHGTLNAWRELIGVEVMTVKDQNRLRALLRARR